MHKIPLESLKTNTNYLKSCILYEVLSEKPISDCYRHFCKRNGEDAMGYGDFEYYYYRFYSGDVDIEHERRIDFNEKTLTGLPLEILGMITGYLEPEERVHLRLTSKIFKTIVDTEPVTFEQIAAEWTPDVFRSYINDNYFEYKIANGRFIRDGYADESSESAFDRFAQVLKHPKLRVDRLFLKFSNDVLPEEKEQFLKSFPHSFHLKTAVIQGSVEETLTILSRLKPVVLKRIEVTGCPRELAPVFESAHWKQAEQTHVNSTQMTSKSFPLFYNLSYFHINVTSMELNDLHLLIANVAKNPSFQFCFVKAVTVTSLELVEPFPMQERMENDGSLRLRYQIPDSSHYLEIYKGNNSVFCIQKN
ncbi:hypothetical protein GCK72_021716 [Caenorhabditis remanei]|uniref:F-box domain-containing protein n=1 Tax=Caenorhabditis remanei TaxID=31234 RepID=A0A6A5GIW0_CAERE|nr:hypothetical protein GCK72_021716 [Caenorhabditis remanei]KAF1755147.1 hypothetical protein GCK72_021716 [Caenorhabditis remanei]